MLAQGVIQIFQHGLIHTEGCSIKPYDPGMGWQKLSYGVGAGADKYFIQLHLFNRSYLSFGQGIPDQTGFLYMVEYMSWDAMNAAQMKDFLIILFCIYETGGHSTISDALEWWSASSA